MAKKRGLNIALLDSIVDKLLKGKSLEEKNRDHELKSALRNFTECHTTPCWLLIYLLENNILTLTLVDTETHAALFDM